MKKRLLALALSAAMVFSLVACGESVDITGGADNNNSGDANGGGDLTGSTDVVYITDPQDGNIYEVDVEASGIKPADTVTLTVASQTANTNSEQQGWFAKVMLDKFNVKLHFIQAAGDQFNTLMESGSMGDIIVFGDAGDNFQDAISNGLLLDWNENDLMEKYAPYIYSLKDTDLKKPFERCTQDTNGVVYSLSNEIGSGDSHQPHLYYPGIRWDLYKELGCPTIGTLEDYIGVLKDMQALEPESDIGTKTYGVTLHTAWEDTAFMVMYVKSTAAFYGWDEFHCGLYNSATHEFQGCLHEDGIYLRCLKFYYNLYKEGLVDPDSETNGWDECAEAMSNGETLMDIYNYVVESYNTAGHLEAGKAMVPIAADDFTTLAYGINNYGGSYQMCIGSKTEYPELCMAIINWAYSPDGALTIRYGPQASTASDDATDGIWYYDSEGYIHLTDFGNTCLTDNTTVFNGGEYKSGLCGWNFQTMALDTVNVKTPGDTYNNKTWKYARGINEYPIIQDYFEYYGVDSFDDYCNKKLGDNITIVPSIPYTATTKKKALKTTWAYVYDIVRTDSWLALKCGDDAKYEEIVAQMIKDGYDAGYADCLEYAEGEAAIRTELELSVTGE